MSRYAEAYTKINPRSVQLFKAELARVEEKMRDLVEEYFILHRQYGDLLQTCRRLGVGGCSSNPRCQIRADRGGTQFCDASDAEENITTELENKLIAAGLNPENFRF